MQNLLNYDKNDFIFLLATRKSPHFPILGYDRCTIPPWSTSSRRILEVSVWPCVIIGWLLLPSQQSNSIQRHPLQSIASSGGGGKIWTFMKQKSTKSTLLVDNTQGLIPTKQTKPRPVASAARGGGGMNGEWRGVYTWYHLEIHNTHWDSVISRDTTHTLNWLLEF